MFKIILIASFITFGYSDYIDNLPKYSINYNKSSNPYEDLNKAMANVKISNKKILLLVGGDWCRWCGTLDNFLEDKEDIGKEFYRSFEVVKVYYGQGINENAKSLLKQFPPLKGTPHFYILNKNAKLLKSINTKYLERGYSYNKRKIKQFIKENR